MRPTLMEITPDEPEQITTLDQLISARERKKAVVCPFTGGWFRPRPAAFIANLSGEMLHRLMKSGMYVYRGKANI